MAAGVRALYGFIGGENNQWYPALYERLNPVEPPTTPEQGCHLTEDLADHAIDWVRSQKALMPDKPFSCTYCLDPPRKFSGHFRVAICPMVFVAGSGA